VFWIPAQIRRERICIYPKGEGQGAPRESLPVSRLCQQYCPLVVGDELFDFAVGEVFAFVFGIVHLFV